MNKFFIALVLLTNLMPLLVFADDTLTPPQTAQNSQPAEAMPQLNQAQTTDQQLSIAYNFAYSLYTAQKFDQAKGMFQKLAAASTQPTINANSLYYYAQCAFRTGDYDGCLKGLDLLVKRWPNSPEVAKGYVTQFATFLIDQVAELQTNWNYYRYKNDTFDEKGNPQFTESVPPSYKLKRINFKLGFGLYKILQEIQTTSPTTVSEKQKLDAMLNLPIKILWVDEKAPLSQYGHPADFYAIITPAEKKQFSNVICERIFYNWKTDKLCDFFDTYDDVENSRPKYVAKTKEVVNSTTENLPILPYTAEGAANGQKPPALVQVNDAPKTLIDPTAVLTLANLFQVSGYNPYTDTFTTTNAEPIQTMPGL
jgi:tetratricopeptide (TPR) repeat protein